ncbi:hypothetical protein ACRAWF_14505 [Streptomyces sp. L7]
MPWLEWNLDQRGDYAALRHLFGNSPRARGRRLAGGQHPIAGSLARCAALIALFAPLAVRRYARGER